jgi:hypothetical protein
MTYQVNFKLKFGKHKGMEFKNTPKSYQDWLLSQDWFKESREYNDNRKCCCGGFKALPTDVDCGVNCDWRYEGKTIIKYIR